MMGAKMTVYRDDAPQDLLDYAKRISSTSADRVRKLNETGDIVYMDEMRRIVKRSPDGVISVVKEAISV